MTPQIRVHVILHLASWMCSGYLFIRPPKRKEKKRKETGRQERREGEREGRDRKKKQEREPYADSVVLFLRMIPYLKRTSLQMCTEFS